jgi:inosine-uridine nucleoside N-ribohydrolase
MRPILLLLLASFVLWTQPVPVIFDTDMGNDIDDALALSMLHALHSRGEIELKAITVTKDHPSAAPFVDMVNTFYGRYMLPIGMVRDGVTKQPGKYLNGVLEMKDSNGQLVFPRQLRSGTEAPEAVDLIRRTLTRSNDNSVVIIQVGFATNLARLLVLPSDVDLVKQKVKLVVAMFGQFPSDEKKPAAREYNVKEDIASAQAWTKDWPTPVVFSGYEVGHQIKFPAESITKDFNYATHPVVEAYKLYGTFPYDRSTYDLTAVLYAARPDRGYFGLSEPGTVSVDATGRNFFVPSPNGQHRYLTVNPEQRARVLEALIYLSSEPPHGGTLRVVPTMTSKTPGAKVIEVP